MPECPRCHTVYDEKPAFCGTCGTKMSEEDPLIEPPGDPLIGLIIDNRYRILDLIGRGGMGAVYRVEHVKMGKIMAMKILKGELSNHQDLVKRFRREAETVSRLSHINTVSVFDFGSDKGMMYLVMEYIDGRDLGDIVRQNGPLPSTKCFRALIQVCSALSEAHEKGIIHRDLKPENIIVGRRDDREDFVKVLDFGLAKLRNIQRTKITEQGSLVGTPYYMAPEHIRSEDVDQRSDLYALGAVMFKLLTGEPPFKGPTAMAIITKHLTENPPPPSESSPDNDIPKSADAICLKAMAKSPEDRYSSANEMRRALADALEQESPNSEFHRFTTTERPSWRGAPKAVTEKMEAVRSETPRPDAAPAKPRASFVTIGSRAMAIGTRSDFYHYAKNRKRRKWSTVLFLMLALFAVGVVAYLGLRWIQGRSGGGESEPNNALQEADLLAAEAPTAARITPGDIDWYRLRGPATGFWAVAAEISGVPGVDTTLQLFDAQGVPLLVSNRAGPGGEERLGPWVVRIPEVYLAIREAGASGQPGPFEAPYQITYHVYDATGLEVEPNNRGSEATPITLRKAVSGTLQPNDPVDWFVIGPEVTVRSVQVSTASAVDVALDLHIGTRAAFRIDRLGPGQGEAERLPAGAGPTYIGVVAKSAVNAPTAYQLLVE